MRRGRSITPWRIGGKFRAGTCVSRVRRGFRLKKPRKEGFYAGSVCIGGDAGSDCRCRGAGRQGVEQALHGAAGPRADSLYGGQVPVGGGHRPPDRAGGLPVFSAGAGRPGGGLYRRAGRGRPAVPQQAVHRKGSPGTGRGLSGAGVPRGAVPPGEAARQRLVHRGVQALGL